MMWPRANVGAMSARAHGIGCRSIGTHSIKFNKSPSSNAGQWILTIPLFLREHMTIWLRMCPPHKRENVRATQLRWVTEEWDIFMWRPGDDAEQPKIEKKNGWTESPEPATLVCRMRGPEYIILINREMTLETSGRCCRRRRRLLKLSAPHASCPHLIIGDQ